MFQFPSKMMRVFKDEQMQSSFERDGYVVLKDVVSAAELPEFKS
mgnify:CR=1 FL=1